MSERGVFAVDRGIWDHPAFADEKFSEREAFIWMLGRAAWRPTRVRVGMESIDLARGQLACSTRFLAECFEWSESRVRRFLGRLSEAGIITTITDRKATHVTILKYDRFQRVSLPDAESRRDADAPATHLRRTYVSKSTHQAKPISEECQRLIQPEIIGATQERRTSVLSVTECRRKEEDIEYNNLSSLRSERAPAAPSPRRTKVKADWQIGEAETAAAEKAGISCPRAAEIWPQFIDYHAGKGTIMADWLAAWRTWCRNDVKFSARGAGQRQRSPPKSADFWATDALDANAELTGGRYDNRPFNRDADPWDRSGEPGGRRLDQQASQQVGADPRRLPALRVVGSR